MYIFNQKLFREIFKNKREGISLIAVIIIMLIVATLSLAIVSTMSTSSISSISDMQAQQAFYLAHAGLEWYMEQLENDSDWSTPPKVKTDEEFGVGTFSVSYSNEATDSIDITVTGKVMGWDGNTVQRIATEHIEKSAGGGTTFKDFALYFGGGDGAITSSIAREQTITGDTFINGDISIGKNCTITGDVSATGSISVGSGTNISGDTNESTSAPANQPTITTIYYDNLISTAASETLGGRDFEAETISGITYVNGDVSIDDYIDGSGTIVATGTISINRYTDIGDNIILISSGSLDMGKDGNVGKNVIFYSSSDIGLGQGIVLGAGAGSGEGTTLLSPGDIELAKNITMTGFIFGDDISVTGPNLTFTGNIAGNRLVELKKGAVVTLDDSKVDYTSVEGLNTGDSVQITTSLWQESL